MAKIILTSGIDNDRKAKYVNMNGDPRDLTMLLMLAEATFFIRTKRPDISMLRCCIQFALSVWMIARDMVKKGMTEPGIYIDGEDRGNER